MQLLRDEDSQFKQLVEATGPESSETLHALVRLLTSGIWESYIVF